MLDLSPARGDLWRLEVALGTLHQVSLMPMYAKEG